LSCHGNISVPSFLCIGNSDTFIFVKELLEETFGIFDSNYLHVGGAILPTHQFETCPKCRTLMQKQGLQTQTDLYDYYVKQIRENARQNRSHQKSASRFGIGFFDHRQRRPKWGT
jgi:hexosaminidase